MPAEGTLDPLLCIVGPTAVGKTALAMALAEYVAIEVVSADSRQIYRRMDIGTAKRRPPNAFAYRTSIDVSNRRDPNVGSVPALAQRRSPRFEPRKGAVLVEARPLRVALLENWEIPQVRPDPDTQAPGRRAEHGGAFALHERLAQVDPQAAAAIHPHNVRRSFAP